MNQNFSAKHYILEERIKKKYSKVNMKSYEETYNSFEYETAIENFQGLGNGYYNIAYEAIDKHLENGKADKLALIWEGPDNQIKKFTFKDISEKSNQVANMLKSLGVKKGDRVFTFLSRIPELYDCAIGVPKMGGVLGPLFAAFGPEAVRDRLLGSAAKVLITDKTLYERVAEIEDQLVDLEYIVIIGDDVTETDKILSYSRLINEASKEFEIEKTDLEDPFILHYTSGSTGSPKGIIHVHKAMLGHYQTAKWVLDLREDDIYWCSADPGWVTGTSYGIFGVWLHGVTQVVNAELFSARNWYKTLERNKVTVWYTAPTALRMLMKAGDEITRDFDFPCLRHICSVGEPLNPEVIRWGLKVFYLPIHDTWWQTETGSMMIVNFPCMDIKPGSMGRPVPGIKAAVIDQHGSILPRDSVGLLALRPTWPSMMRQVWGDEEKYNEYFKIKGWYLSGDNAYVDDDGYFWFIGRADDIINTSGHRVGPFEVENALVDHPAIAEAGVIGKPDEERGEIIKAFVTLRDGYENSDELFEDIKKFVRKHLAAHAYPREIEVLDSLPKTRSGKIMRRVLKAKELGLPLGDLSTMEE